MSVDLLNGFLVGYRNTVCFISHGISLEVTFAFDVMSVFCLSATSLDEANVMVMDYPDRRFCICATTSDHCVHCLFTPCSQPILCGSVL